ncbi:PAS domain-containing protein [Tenacibaculum sp. 190130A14a]|uniref:PAS domain-containing protein n=1 Tax=Tenacibaculum polynesiense TaxID=3137857 RepID=A0ABM9P8H8_9FLAO
MKNDFNNMMSLDLYLSSLHKDEYNRLSSLIPTSTKQNINLLSWGIQDLFNNATLRSDLKEVQNLADKFEWKNSINQILKSNIYESLVITNSDKKIIWVNNGFEKMTGYETAFAIGKSPSFLQGKKTSNASRERIRKKLLKNKPFTEIILNYKKDQSSYTCELKIFPLKANNNTTHFLALEKAVS